MSTEAEKRASRKYDKEHVVQISVKLNKKTDEDILKFLKGIENKQGYIKTLIRHDIYFKLSKYAKGEK